MADFSVGLASPLTKPLSSCSLVEKDSPSGSAAVAAEKSSEDEEAEEGDPAALDAGGILDDEVELVTSSLEEITRLYVHAEDLIVSKPKKKIQTRTCQTDWTKVDFFGLGVSLRHSTSASCAGWQFHHA